jgi:hypothetical protein
VPGNAKVALVLPAGAHLPEALLAATTAAGTVLAVRAPVLAALTRSLAVWAAGLAALTRSLVAVAAPEALKSAAARAMAPKQGRARYSGAVGQWPRQERAGTARVRQAVVEPARQETTSAGSVVRAGEPTPETVKEVWQAAPPGPAAGRAQVTLAALALPAPVFRAIISGRLHSYWFCLLASGFAATAKRPDVGQFSSVVEQHDRRQSERRFRCALAAKPFASRFMPLNDQAAFASAPNGPSGSAIVRARFRRAPGPELLAELEYGRVVIAAASAACGEPL